MKKLLRWTAGVLAGLLLILALVLLLKDSIIKSFAQRRLLRRTGLTVTIGQVRVGLISSTVALKDFRVLNPAGFGDTLLLNIPEASCVLDVSQAKTNRLHFNELTLRLAELNVIKNKDGLLNLDSVKESIRLNALKDRDKKKLIFKFGGIDRLHLTLEQVNYLDENQPTNQLRLALGVKNETVTNLQTEEDFNRWANAFLMRVAFQQYLMNPKLKEGGLNFLFQGNHEHDH